MEHVSVVGAWERCKGVLALGTCPMPPPPTPIPKRCCQQDLLLLILAAAAPSLPVLRKPAPPEGLQPSDLPAGALGELFADPGE